MPKRKSTEAGSIRIDKEGAYCVSIQINGRRKSTRVSTRELAEEKLKEYRALLSKEAFVSEHAQSPDATLSEIAEKFIEFKADNEAKKVRSTSSTRLEATIRNQILSFQITKTRKLGDVAFCKVTSEMIQNNINALNQQYAESTVKKVQAAWGAIYQYAIDRLEIMKIEDNPMRKVDKISKDNFNKPTKPLDIYTAEEIEILEKELTKISTDRLNKGNPSYNLGCLLMLGAYTGLRAGELCGLRKADIDLENKTLRVEQQIIDTEAHKSDREKYPDKITEKGRIKRVGQPKTESGIRTVPLSPKAIYYVNRLLEQFPIGEMLAYNVDGDYASPVILAKHLKQACKRTGVRHISGKGAHAMRDYFATICYDEGIELEVVSKWMGHSDPKTTWKYYIALGDRRQTKAIEILNSSEKFQDDKSENEAEA